LSIYSAKFIRDVLDSCLADVLPDPLACETAARLDDFWQTDTAAMLPPDAGFLQAMARVWAYSPFVSRTLTRHPFLFESLLQDDALRRPRRPKAFRPDLPPRALDAGEPASRRIQSRIAAISEPLRLFRLREAVRIAWRDLAGLAGLEETVGDLTLLADGIITTVLSDLYAVYCEAYGTPVDRGGRMQPLLVVGLGKLGAFELNFSSDVDLVFAYPDEGWTRHAPQPISNFEFFTRLGRGLVRALSEKTENGPVFRVDLRLRPDGENGPLVMTFENMEAYYQRHGREWERYAWIKARVVAGDGKAGRRLLSLLKPFVYRRYLDFGVFEALREMKHRISIEMRKKTFSSDIKLGRGGIREIEFFGQVFQLIRGGVTPGLRRRRIRRVLKTLVQIQAIDRRTGDVLDAAYVFLRLTEHRLQAMYDQQTHLLPQDPIDRMRLFRSMGFRDWASFERVLNDHMHRVHGCFSRLLASGRKSPACPEDVHRATEELACLWHNLSHGQPPPVRRTEAAGPAGETLRLLAAFKDSPRTRALSREGRNRIDRLMPLVLEKTASMPKPQETLKRILVLLETIERRTCYIALLLENPNALDHLIRLSSASPWIVTLLAQHPVLLDELLDPRALYQPPSPDLLEKEIRQRLKAVPADDLEYQLEALSIFKQVNTLRVAAADIAGALPLMKVSDHLTAVAEILVRETVALAWRHLVRRHGAPAAAIDGHECKQGFAVIGYGKLGGIELGYGSDLDLVFIHAGSEADRGTAPIGPAQFYARLGQRVVHCLSAHTAAGKMYAIDMRLRPSGSAGLLVSQFRAFEAYQRQDAWTWEHQALLRARPVTGDPLLMNWFQDARSRILTQPRPTESLRRDVAGMRQRLRRELLHRDPARFDIKQSAGGLVDIEFLVQFLVLANAARHPDLVQYSDNVRQIQALAACGVIDEQAAHLMRHAYLVYRATIHRLSLRHEPALVDVARFGDLRRHIADLWRHWMHRHDKP